MYVASKYLLIKWFSITKSRKVTSVEKQGNYQLNQGIRVNTTSYKMNWHHVPPDMMH